MSDHQPEPRPRPPGAVDDRDLDERPAGEPEPGRAERFDAGRSDDSPGYDVQARLFGGVALWLAFISVLYGFLSREYAGTTFLAMSAALNLLIAGYLGWHQPRKGTVEDREEGEGGLHEGDEDWFPESSIWPFVLGAAMALVGNGLLLGRWLLLPSLVFLAWALAGFTRQTRWRS